MASSVPPEDPVDKVRLVLDYVPAEVLRQIARDDEELELLDSLNRRLDRDVTAKSIRHTTVVVERPEPEPVEEIAPPAELARDGDAEDEELAEEMAAVPVLQEIEDGDEADGAEEPAGEAEPDVLHVYSADADERATPREVVLRPGDAEAELPAVTVVPDTEVYLEESADALEAEEAAAVPGGEEGDALDLYRTGPSSEVTPEGVEPQEDPEPLAAEPEAEEEDELDDLSFVGTVGDEDGWEPADPEPDEEAGGEPEWEDLEAATDAVPDEDPGEEAEDVDDGFTFTPPAAEEPDEGMTPVEEDEESLEELWRDLDEAGAESDEAEAEEGEDPFDAVGWPEEEEEDAFELVDPSELASEEAEAQEAEAYDPWGEQEAAEPGTEPDGTLTEEAEEEVLTFELDEDEGEAEVEFETLGEATEEEAELPEALPWDDEDEEGDARSEASTATHGDTAEAYPEEAEAEPASEPLPAPEPEPEEVREERDEPSSGEPPSEWAGRDLEPDEEPGEPGESFEVPPEEAEVVEEQGTPEEELAGEPEPEEPSPEAATASGAGIPVEELPGVGSIYAGHLSEVGIESTADLLDRDPWGVSQDTEISPELLEEWIRIAGFVHRLGVASVYATVLAKVGVEGVEDLLDRDPEDVAQEVNRYIASSEGGDVPPPTTAEQVARWQAGGRRDDA